MSVTNETNKVNYAAAGLSVYAIPFFFLSNSHIKLYVDDVLKTINTDYTVTGAGDLAGGELTLVMTAPVSGTVTIVREVPLKQENTFNEGGSFAASTLERMFDTLTYLAQQINEKIGRAVKFPLSSEVDPQMTGEILPGSILQANSAGDGLEFGLSAVAYQAALDAKVAAAQLAETNAETAETNAELAEANAETAEANAETAQALAEAAKVAAEAAKLAAENAQAAVELALNSVGWQDTVPVSANTVLDASYNGSLILVDCSLGGVTITLPAIAGLDLDFPFSIGIKKSDSSGNSITIARASTDTIDGATSKTIGTAGSGVVLIPDSDTSPDLWSSVEFGATAGNMTIDRFSGTGAQTAFVLSVSPGSENNTDVYIHGIYQQKDTYSLSGTTLTFDEAPVLGTNNIEVRSGTTLPSGVPSDASVSTAKIVDLAVTTLKINDLAVTEGKLAAALLAKLTLKYLKASGNAGQVITAAVTNIPFITVTDTTGGWNGSQFTVPETAAYQISGQAFFTTGAGRSPDLYIGGTIYKRMADAASQTTHNFNICEVFTAGQVLSIRDSVGGTLQNSALYHYLNITKLPGI